MRHEESSGYQDSRLAFSISVINFPFRQIRTVPVDSLMVIAMLLVAAVMAAAEACLAPRP